MRFFSFHLMPYPALPDAAHLAPLERGPELAEMVRGFIDG